MRTRIAGGLFVSHLRSETDLKSHKQTKSQNQHSDFGFLLGKEFIGPFSVFLGVYRDRRHDPVAWIR